MSITSLRMKVGIGSRLHDFDGEFIMILRNSSLVKLAKSVIDEEAGVDDVGVSFPSVLALTAATLSWKNFRKFSAVIVDWTDWLEELVFFRITDDKDLHNFVGLSPS